MIGVLRGVVRVRKTWRPSQVPNRRYAPKTQGDSRLQVEKEKESIAESLSNPPAPPNPIAQQWDVPHHYTTWKERECRVCSYLISGGTDVEHIKREFGVSDKCLRTLYDDPYAFEEHRQENLSNASPYVQACLAKLNQITNQDDDLELLDVVTIHTSMPYGCTSGLLRHHMHFRAMPKSNADPGHESSRLYCAVYIGWGEKEFHVVGCVRLENDCPGGTDVEHIKREFGVSDKCLRTLYDDPYAFEEHRQENLRDASPYVQACLAKLNQITNQLLDVVFVHNSMPYGCNNGIMRYHMHFRAMPKSKADPGHESSRLYCAVYIVWGKKQCHVVGCVRLENDCPDGAGCCNDETLAKCLDAARCNAKTSGELDDLPPEVDYNELYERARESSRKREEMRRAKGEKCELDEYMAFLAKEEGKDVSASAVV